ncbi:hypothetical protein C1H46_004656 [Malus baccata]|uniref:Uncharacterized protein n=1 Tax=Malus baccata TaxID=106549 RepID=A0A540NF92_MALBA|nr:hypothetical protein C1H46_004656 [Malus baccata]
MDLRRRHRRCHLVRQKLENLAGFWRNFKPSYLHHFSTIFDKLYMEMKLGKRRISLYLPKVQKWIGNGSKWARDSWPLLLSQTHDFLVGSTSKLG